MNRFDDTIRQLARHEEFELPWEFTAALAAVCADLPETPPSGAGKKKVKRLGVTLLAAALLIGLSAAAAANFRVGEWFEKYFGAETEDGLTPAQVSVIEEKTTDVGKSDTVNGYTVTVDSIINDNYTVYARLKVTAPEGLIFTDRKKYFFESFGFDIGPITNAPGHYGGSSGSCAALDDGTDPDNVLTMLVTLNYLQYADSGKSLNDKPDRTLQLGNLCDGHSAQGYKDKWGNDLVLPHIAVPGIWSVDVTLKGDSGSIELVTEPVKSHGQTGERGLEGPTINVDVTITSFVLTAFGAKCTFGFGEGVIPQALDFPDVCAVMKDGTEYFLRRGAAAGGKAGGMAAFSFAAPVDIAQVDHVRLTDGTILKAEA